MTRNNNNQNNNRNNQNNNQQLEVLPEYVEEYVEQYGAGKMELLRDTICSELSMDQLGLFLEVCRSKKLDPFSRQIYPVIRNSQVNGRWEKKMTIQTGIDGFRSQAQRSGQYEGQTPYEWSDKTGNWTEVWLEKYPPAAARVGIYRAGFQQPMYAVALFDEYKQTKRDGSLNQMWNTYPTVMLAKCAEAIGLRRAFPDELSGLYSSDEMPEEVKQERLERKVSRLQKQLEPVHVQDAEFEPKKSSTGAMLEIVEAFSACKDFDELQAAVDKWMEAARKMPERVRPYLDAWLAKCQIKVSPDDVDVEPLTDEQEKLAEAVSGMRKQKDIKAEPAEEPKPPQEEAEPETVDVEAPAAEAEQQTSEEQKEGQ